jgi:hypothetical protein
MEGGGQCEPPLLVHGLPPAMTAIAGTGPVSFPDRRRVDVLVPSVCQRFPQNPRSKCAPVRACVKDFLRILGRIGLV